MTDEGGNVKVMNLEIIRKDEYVEWKKNPQFIGAELAKQRKPEDLEPIGQQHRFDISHLNLNLEAWEARVTNLTTPLYSYTDVSNMTEDTTCGRFHYVLDDLTWQCEYSVKVWESSTGNLKKTLVIHMPNDGYFYINGVVVEAFLGAKAQRTNQFNNRHSNTCPNGWAILEKTVWEKLAPFKSFMRTWFGEAFDLDRMELMVLYHADANRIDLCMRQQDTHVAIEFLFEHSYPIALEDGWWSTF